MTRRDEYVAVALWQAWVELENIIARDGVPYKRDGKKSDVSEEYFCKVKDDCETMYEWIMGEEIKPWLPKFGWLKGSHAMKRLQGPTDFAKRRNKILDELVQMKNDIDHWNDTHPNEEPLVIDFDLSKDLIELEGKKYEF